MTNPRVSETLIWAFGQDCSVMGFWKYLFGSALRTLGVITAIFGLILVPIGVGIPILIVGILIWAYGGYSKARAPVENIRVITTPVSSRKNFCAYCGARLNLGSPFCPNCGQSI